MAVHIKLIKGEITLISCVSSYWVITTFYCEITASYFTFYVFSFA